LDQACAIYVARSSCRSMNPPMISKMLMMMNQIPSSTARTLSEEVAHPESPGQPAPEVVCQ
jgi:hypothetical protein